MTTIEATGVNSGPIARPEARSRLWRAVMPYLLVLPTFLFIFAFTLWPAVSAVIQSTIKPGPTVRIPDKFVGLDNYTGLFNPDTEVGQAFPHILVQTIIFVGVTVPVSMVFA